MISHKLAWILSLATFAFGVFADSWLNLQQPVPTVEIDHTYRTRDPNISLNGRIQIELASTRTINSKEREATFKITNRTVDPIDYSGYFEGNIAQAWIRRNGNISDSVELSCWNGVETQTLEPTQSAYFTVPIPPKGRLFDVGFDFRIGLRRGWETVWFRFPEFPSAHRKT